MKNESSQSDFHAIFNPMITTILSKIPLSAVILFGSQAKDQAKPTSDYDIIIIGKFSQRFIDRGVWISQFLPPLPIDVFCYTPQEFEVLFRSFQLTAIDGIGEGVVLYGEDFVIPYKARFEEYKARGMRKYKNVLLIPK